MLIASLIIIELPVSEDGFGQDVRVLTDHVLTHAIIVIIPRKIYGNLFFIFCTVHAPLSKGNCGTCR